MVSPGVRVDPNSYSGVTAVDGCLSLGLGVLPSGVEHQIGVQQVRQPDSSFFQLKFDDCVRLWLIRGGDRGWILVAEVSISNRLSESVPLHHPAFDAPLLPLGLVPRCYPALQLRR